MSVKARLAIFTICSNNYVPAARTFLRSVRRHHPKADLFVCLVDRRIDMAGLYDPDWTVVEAHTLPIHDFAAFSFRYDIMEMNTAVKPFMFQHLLNHLDYDQVLYFDPDIEIFRPLEPILVPLRSGASFVLTPYLCAPVECGFRRCRHVIPRSCRHAFRDDPATQGVAFRRFDWRGFSGVGQA